MGEFIDKFLGKAAPPSGSKKASRVGEVRQDVDSDDLDRVWSSTTPTWKKKSVARNLDEDMHSMLHQAASSSTRLSAEKDDEDEEEYESNVSRLEGPNKMVSSPPRPPGSRLRHIHSCPKDLEFTLWNTASTLTFPSVGVLRKNHLPVNAHLASRRESHLLVEASQAALDRLHGPQGLNLACR